MELVNLQGYSRMPVFEGNLDNVTGTLYVKDLIPLLKEDRPTVDWKTLIRPAYFIPETKKIDSLLDDFKTRRLHIAIVVDEFGGTSGLVTLEDIVEEIFGDIADEFDDVEGYKKIDRYNTKSVDSIASKYKNKEQVQIILSQKGKNERLKKNKSCNRQCGGDQQGRRFAQIQFHGTK